MTLTLQEVEHIANLARLDLNPSEKELFRRQLSDILEYAARLQQVDTGDIPPTSSVLPPHGILRQDESRPGLCVSDILRNAPQTENDQFRVPPVME